MVCKIVTHLPNLVVGQLAAEPALRAMKQGIRVDNIIRYLEGAAHPRAVRRLEQGNSIVPASVRNQLEVWESGRSRTISWHAVLFEWDTSEADKFAFEQARRYA